MKRLYFILFSLILFNCSSQEEKTAMPITVPQQDSTLIYTEPSKLSNQYSNFHSPNAINRISEIENEYFSNYEDSISRYYGTEWMKSALTKWTVNDSVNDLWNYKNEVLKSGLKADSMHCTIYAIEALKAGSGTLFDSVEVYHKKIWKEREHAGWSIAHILTEHFGWKAYLFISESSNEYKRCIKNYNEKQLYWVWKQPDIKLEGLYNFDSDDLKMDSLLNQHEFGWGFSDQGYHTWITRFDTLKECNWLGTPSIKYDSTGTELFKKTKFTEYFDYTSHIVVFPPKK